MKKLKDMFARGMSKIMLNCEKATLLITKNEYEQLGFVSRFKLKMHLASCKFCRNFSEQSKYITTRVQDVKAIDPAHLKIHLSPEQKTRIARAVEQETIKN